MSNMTRALENAVAIAAKLETDQQDALAALLLAEIGDDAQWDRAFSSTPHALEALAAEARQEYKLGQTRELDPGDFGVDG